jgi:hypothetical protein
MRSVRLTLLVCSVLASVLIAELLVRYVAPIDEAHLLPFPYNGDRVRQIAAGDTYLTFDADLGWNLTPSRTRRADGAIFRINSQSIRADREYPLKGPANVQRITAFGDSFTHCSETTQVDCWTVQLEHALPETEVLNFGVPGFGPDQAWLRYQRDGRKFAGCAVLIGYFVGDIERVVNRFRPYIYPDDSVVLGKPRYLLDGDGLRLLPNAVTDLRLLRDPVWAEQNLSEHDSWYFPGTFVSRRLDASWLVRLARTALYQQARQKLQRTPTGYPIYGEDQEAYQVTRRVLLQFAEQVGADGAAPVILVMPGILDLELAQAGTIPYAALIEQLRAAGYPTIDLTPDLLDELTRRSMDDIFEDTHYSKIGNGVVARALARELPPMIEASCRPR